MFIKTFKKAISLFVVVVFVLSLIPTAAFALDAATGDWFWTGDDNPKFRNNTKQSGTTVYTTSIDVRQDGVYGKTASDMVYRVYDHSTKNSHSLSQAGDFELQGGAGNSSDYVIEFSFAFTSPNDSIGTYFQYFSSIENILSNSRESFNNGFFSLNSSSITFMKQNFSYSFEPHKWYNICLVVDSEDTKTVVNSSATPAASYTHHLYVNGTHIGSPTLTTAFYGSPRLRLGNGALGNNIYWDNIEVKKVVSAANYEPQDVQPATLTANDNSVTIIEDTITAPGDMTIGQLDEKITSSDVNASIRYYNSDYSTELQRTDKAKNANIVIASKRNGTDMENTFSYYSVKKWEYEYEGIYDGFNDIKILIEKKSSGSTPGATFITSDGSAGKLSSDKVYVFTDAEGNPYGQIDNAVTDKKEVLEFSAMLPKGSNGASFEFKGSGDSTMSFSITPDGVMRHPSSTTKVKIFDIEPDKWYNFAFVSSGADEFDSSGNPTHWDKTYEFYMNGVMAGPYTAVTGLEGQECSSGIDRFRLRGSNASGDMSPTLLFDNVRYTQEEYNPDYDKEAVVSGEGVDTANKTITLVNAKVADVLNSVIISEDDRIEIYNNLGQKITADTTAPVLDGYTVVVATKNNTEMERAYSYYTIVCPKYFADINILVGDQEAGATYDDISNITVNANFVNYDEENHSVTLYVAQYQDDTLIDLWQNDAVIASDGTAATLSVNLSDMENRSESSIKAMLLNASTLYPYTASKTMRYNMGSTPATLYLVGDSIVQTYTSDRYPLQGWGYYIQNYFNTNITVDNRAQSGWTTDSFLYPDSIYTKKDGILSDGTILCDRNGNKKSEISQSLRYKCWDSIMEDLKPGDYVMISLGINDSGSGNVPKDRYVENLSVMYEQATAKGATVLFSTPTISAGEWEDTDAFRESVGGGRGLHGKYCSDYAASVGAVCIPLGATLDDLYNEMLAEYKEDNPEAADLDAKQYVRAYFHLYAEPINTPKEDGGWGLTGSTYDDGTHFNERGADKLADIITELIKESGSPLGDYVKTK